MSGAPAQMPSGFLPALTGVRALAAFWVLSLHFKEPLDVFFGFVPFVTPLIHKGHQAVDLFFVLSGFIIAYHYADSFRTFRWRAFGPYLWARIARIYPLYGVMLLVFVGLVNLAPVVGFTINRSGDYTLMGFIANVLMIQAWNFPASPDWNYVGWSVSAEWLVYLLTPFFVALLAGVRHRFFDVYLLVVFVTLAPLAFYLGGIPHPSAYAVFRVIGAFGAGMIAHKFFEQRVLPVTWAPFVVWAGLGSIVGLALFEFHHVTAFSFLTVPGSVLFILALAYQRGRVAQMLSTRFFTYWGQVSYALYITQFAVLMVLKKLVPLHVFAARGVVWQVGYLMVTLIMVLAAAVAGYHVIEKPARTWLRRHDPFI